MSTEKHPELFYFLPVGAALIMITPVGILFSPALAAGIFGAICIVSAMRFFNASITNKYDVKRFKKLVMVGTILGIIIHVTGTINFAGSGSIILFAGLGALLAMLESAVGARQKSSNLPNLPTPPLSQ
jgi:hypothetical protein